MTFRANLLIVAFVASILGVAQGHYWSKWKCTFRAAGRKTRFLKSSTTFNIINTFATVESQLEIRAVDKPHKCYKKKWSKSKSCKNFKKTVNRNILFFLPANAVVDQMELAVLDGTTYRAQIMTTAQAVALYKSGGSGKALLLSRWTNEQFKLVTLFTKFKYGQVSTVKIRWRYLIPLEHNRFRIYFPVNMPSAYADAIVEVSGTVTEAQDINFFEVQSPDSTLYTSTVTTVTPNQKTVSFSGTFREFKRWLKNVTGRRRWNRWYPYRRWTKKGSSSSSSEVIRRARSSSYEHDLVFSLVYNHTLASGSYLFIAFRQFQFQLWTNATRQCVTHGITVENLMRQHLQDPAIQIFPQTRRLTIFIDDISQLDTAYFDNIRVALKEVIMFGSDPDRPFEFLNPLFGVPDSRVFTNFRIILLQQDGTVVSFPSTAGTFADAVDPVDPTIRGPDVQAALDFIDLLPGPSGLLIPGFTFDQTQIEFVKMLAQYRGLVEGLATDAAKNEISDIFYLSNAKPEGSGGNFRIAARNRFVTAIEAEQQLLRAFTGRTYGQPIFTFGFGPKSDFNLLDTISVHNDGATRMAFSTATTDEVTQQILSFFAGIGRVVAGDIQISQMRLFYVDGTMVPQNHALFDAGFNIPILRDLEEFHTSFQIANPTTPNPADASSPFGLERIEYDVDFLPAGQSARVQIPNRQFFFDQPPTQDPLDIANNLQAQGAICSEADVVQVLVAEQGLRMLADGEAVTTSEVGLKTMMSEAGLRSSLQTTETSFYLENLQEYQVTAQGGSQAATADETAGAGERSFYAVFACVIAAVVLY